MAHVTLKPGALRELHWHPNADEWQYYIQGSGRMTVFFNRATSRTTDFRAGDVGFVPQTLGHYVENTGDTDLVFLEMFKGRASSTFRSASGSLTSRPNLSSSIWEFRSRRFRRSRAPTTRCCRPSGRVGSFSSLRTKQSNRYP
jgi:oxalate decarboxylase/phosphoglucose isomerase-like protein (cupin superfamily)